MKSSNITTKNFGRKLGGVVKSAKTMRANLQNLILFGMEHYSATGDTVYLTKCMHACVGVSSLPTQKMKQFIQHHANVSYRKIKNKAGNEELVFKKRGKVAEYSEPTTNWWDFSNAGQATPDLDTDARIINFIKAIDKGIESGKVKDKDHAVATKKALEGLVTKLHIAV